MAFDPVLADIRFGCGLSPQIPPARGAGAMIATLSGPDMAADRFAIEPYPTFQKRVLALQQLANIKRANRGTPRAVDAAAGQKTLLKQVRADQIDWYFQHLMRRTWTTQPFRERLCAFWADHFTATGKGGVLRAGASPYVDTALRPHISGRFEDLLIAAIAHPLMVHYLDQQYSVGPGSAVALKAKRPRGLNENLAREVLELHTLGVDGPYTQGDVRELAKLFTGMTHHHRTGLRFRADFAEPGAETVLGQTYGGGAASLDDIRAVLRDLARHPATARHIAGKLAVHFVSDTPDPQLITALERRFLDTGGDLMAVYDALLTHPAAWQTDHPNVKRPVDFIGSALRALAVPPEALDAIKRGRLRVALMEPLALMGHVWERPDGPDGPSEVDSAWITPQGLAARLQWAVAVPTMLRPDLPDPREFVVTALGGRASKAVRFAAEAAESRADGVGIILASPSFQRM